MGTTARWRTSHKNLPHIFHLHASWHIATWSSALTKMSGLILPWDPRAHHDLLPDVTSHTITYIFNVKLPRIELRSHLTAALHAVPGGVAHQSRNNIKVTLRHFHSQQSPRQHHWDLIDHLRCYLASYQALRDRILASCNPDDIYNSLTAQHANNTSNSYHYHHDIRQD